MGSGQIYFYGLETSAEPFRIVWRLAQLDEQQALRENTQCKFQPAADGGNVGTQGMARASHSPVAAQKRQHGASALARARVE